MCFFYNGNIIINIFRGKYCSTALYPWGEETREPRAPQTQGNRSSPLGEAEHSSFRAEVCAASPPVLSEEEIPAPCFTQASTATLSCPGNARTRAKYTEWTRVL